MSIILIAGLPAGPTNLTGAELLEIQNGSGANTSQQTTVAKIVALALASAVQEVVAGTGGITVNNTNPNEPVISIPVYTVEPGSGIAVNDANPYQPVVSCTLPTDGGITAAYGTPGGSVLQAANNIQGLATNGLNLTGWAMQCSPSGSIAVDLRVATLGQAPATIIGTGNAPTISGGTFASANTLTGWTSTAVPQGSVIEVYVKSVSAVEWFSVAFYGTKT